MAILEARCPDCRDDVLVDPADTALEWPAPGGEGRVRFACPACSAPVGLPVNELLAEALAQVGSRSLGPCVPAADPLTPDDLLAFHELLATGDWFERLVEGCA